MFLFHPINFFKFLVKSQPQRSYKKGSYIKIRVYVYILNTESRIELI